jgi:hypothetical protein
MARFEIFSLCPPRDEPFWFSEFVALFLTKETEIERGTNGRAWL